MTDSPLKEDSGYLQRFFSDFLNYSVGRIVPALLGVLSLFVFSRIFPPDAYGRYALTMVIVSIFSQVSVGWLGEATIRFEPETETERFDSLVVTVLSITTMSLLCAGIAGYLTFDELLLDYREFYLAGLLLTICLGIYSVFNSLLRARLESRTVMFVTSSQSIIEIILSVFLAIVILNDITGWIWGSVIATSLLIVFQAKRALSSNIHFTFDPNLLKRILAYGLPVVGTTLGGVFLTLGDRLMIEILLGTSEVGLYATNYAIVDRGLPLVLAPIVTAAQPLIMNTWADADSGAVRSQISRISRYFLILGMFATVSAVIFSRFLSTTLLGEAYHEGYVIIPVVAIGVFLWNFATIGHQSLQVKNDTKMILVGFSIAVGVNILFNLMLIPSVGYLGAAIATLVSYLCYFVFVLVVSRKYISWDIPLRTLATTTVSGAVVLLPAIYAYSINARITLTTALPFGILCVVLYFGTLYLLDEFDDEEISAAESILDSY